MKIICNHTWQLFPDVWPFENSLSISLCPISFSLSRIKSKIIGMFGMSLWSRSISKSAHAIKNIQKPFTSSHCNWCGQKIVSFLFWWSFCQLTKWPCVLSIEQPMRFWTHVFHPFCPVIYSLCYVRVKWICYWNSKLSSMEDSISLVYFGRTKNSSTIPHSLQYYCKAKQWENELNEAIECVLCRSTSIKLFSAYRNYCLLDIRCQMNIICARGSLVADIPVIDISDVYVCVY